MGRRLTLRLALFVSKWAKELMDLKKCDVRRLVAKGVIGLRVQKYRRLEKKYTTITIYYSFNS